MTKIPRCFLITSALFSVHKVGLDSSMYQVRHKTRQMLSNVKSSKSTWITKNRSFVYSDSIKELANAKEKGPLNIIQFLESLKFH